MRQTTRNLKIYRLVAIYFLAAISLWACGPNQGVLHSGKDSPVPNNAAPLKSQFEQELDSMRTAGFAFIFVLRRKDGGKIDAEDRGVIKLQTVDTNRRVATDDDRAVIIGSNYQLPPNNLAALYLRFAIDNYSEPVPAAANSNANANK